MQIRAKFKVDEVAQTTYGSKLRASPVYSSGSEENKKFWEATPTGSLDVTCVKAEVLAGFKPGDEFYLDITPATKA